jgi:hypothetical protein
MAYSIVHGGTLPQFLSPVLYYDLCCGSAIGAPKLEDIPDAQLQQELMKVSLLLMPC